MLQIVGYAEGYSNQSIYDSPTSDTEILFEFNTPYYRLTNHLINTEFPCFVNIMFSVADSLNNGVDNLSNEDFIVFEDGNAVSPSETFRYIRKINTIPYQIKTVLLLDNSASVADKLDQIKNAAKALVNQITERQEFAIYYFSEEPVMVQDFTNDIGLLTTAIESIPQGYPTTNLYGSIIEAVYHWDDYYSSEEIEQGYLVAFTDGDDTQGAYTLEQALTARGNKKVYMIGLGEELNPVPMNLLANPGPYFPIVDITELEEVFTEIQNDIILFANSFYWLNYMTPKRENIHTLRLEVDGNTNFGYDSYILDEFNAYGFESVLSGVYINTSQNNSYGVDSLYFNNLDPYSLKAVTYWANEPPQYSWESSNENIVAVEEDLFNTANTTLNFTGVEGGEAIITVSDIPNGYTKTLKVVAYTPPVVQTSPVSQITPTTALSGGNVTGDGGLEITARGVCWNTNGTPTIYQNSSSDSTGLGIYESNVLNLQPSTVYYLRAYATNNKGTSYGDEVSFITLPPGPPVVTTNSVLYSSHTSVNCTGEVISDGGYTVTQKGFCWDTVSNPTLSNMSIQSGNGPGLFSTTITDLIPEKTYYFRAFAINQLDTTYGSEIIYISPPLGPPSITTDNIYPITVSGFYCTGTIIHNGGYPITQMGFCWNTMPEPSLENYYNQVDVGTSEISSSIENLTPNEIYYIRAYAINTFDTAYGDVISIETSDPCNGNNIITYQGEDYELINIAGLCWFKENLNVGISMDSLSEPSDNNIIEKYCYDDNPSNCELYGGLYSWDEMMQYSTDTLAKGICPDGWHIPTDFEWKLLEGATDTQFPIGDPIWDNEFSRGYDTGKNLKSTSGWSSNGNGIDIFGFSAIPAGFFRTDINDYQAIYNQAYLGSSTTNEELKWCRYLQTGNDLVWRNDLGNHFSFSVRCVKN